MIRIVGLVELRQAGERGNRRVAEPSRDARRHLGPEEEREVLQESRGGYSVTLEADDSLIFRYFLHKAPMAICSPGFLFYYLLALVVESDSTVPLS